MGLDRDLAAPYRPSLPTVWHSAMACTDRAYPAQRQKIIRESIITPNVQSRSSSLESKNLYREPASAVLDVFLVGRGQEPVAYPGMDNKACYVWQCYPWNPERNMSVCFNKSPSTYVT